MKTRKFEPDPNWEHVLTDPDCDHHFLGIVRVENQVAGWCRLFRTNSPSGIQAYELGIGVRSVNQRKGFGTHLFSQGVRWARDKGAGAIVLWTHPDNIIAQHFFMKNGFKILQPDPAGLEMILYI